MGNYIQESLGRVWQSMQKLHRLKNKQLLLGLPGSHY